jgi:hypothetical protein
MSNRITMPQLRSLIRGAALALAVVGLAGPALGETLELASGEKLEVTIIDDTGDVIIAEHKIFGRMEIPKDTLKPPDPPGRHERGLFGTRILKNWHRKVAVGFGGSSGVNSDASVNLGLKIDRETEGYRGAFDMAYFFGSADTDGTGSVTTTNKLFGGYQHDLLFGESRWYLFGAARYDYDQFQAWVHRISGNGGVGFDLIRRDKLKMRAEAGIGFAHERGIVSATRPEGVFGLIFDWSFYEGQKLHVDTTYYPDFQNTPLLRLLTNVSWVIDLGFVEGLALDLGVRHELNTSLTGPGRNDVNYYGNIGYEF